MAVSKEEFSKALDSLEASINEAKTDITRDATIQRFEFCVELAWKTSKKVMGTSTSAPKQVIREMAQANLITDVDFWLKSIDQRNLSSHTYNEDLAEEVYNFAKEFLPKAQALLERINKQ
jgi:nucleotidyltransferase substrate binding protein (TIGR01987 family)